MSANNQLGFKPKKYGYLLSFKDNAIDHSATD